LKRDDVSLWSFLGGIFGKVKAAKFLVGAFCRSNRDRARVRVGDYALKWI